MYYKHDDFIEKVTNHKNNNLQYRQCIEFIKF